MHKTWIPALRFLAQHGSLCEFAPFWEQSFGQNPTPETFDTENRGEGGAHFFHPASVKGSEL